MSRTNKKLMQPKKDILKRIPRTDILFVEGIEEAVRTEFKVATIRRDTTMKAALRAFMIEYASNTR